MALRFNGILRRRSSQALDIDTELTAIMRFASVLRRDIDAVKNAIELLEQRASRGSDQPPQDAEESNVRRASPELMRARMLPLNHRN